MHGKALTTSDTCNSCTTTMTASKENELPARKCVCRRCWKTTPVDVGWSPTRRTPRWCRQPPASADWSPTRWLGPTKAGQDGMWTVRRNRFQSAPTRTHGSLSCTATPTATSTSTPKAKSPSVATSSIGPLQGSQRPSTTKLQATGRTRTSARWGRSNGSARTTRFM